MTTRKGIVREVECFQNLGNDDDPYFFRLRGHNGEIVAASEGYDKASDRDTTAIKIAAQLGVEVTTA
jgi:uncharacterized protein YegP (UPF0339 family)